MQPREKTSPSPNIRIVAEMAHVSVATVSRVFSGTNSAIPISSRTADRVRQVAREIGYVPNAAARALRQRRTSVLGLLLSSEALHDLPTERLSMMNMTAQVEAACARRRYGLMLLRQDEGDNQRLLSWIGSRSMDGLILTGFADDEVLRACRQQGVPCVDVWGTMGALPVCSVEADLVTARLEAIRHGVRLGHRRVVIACRDEQRQHDINRALLARVPQDAELKSCEVRILQMPAAGLADSGPWLAERWAATAPEARGTLVLAHEQTSIGFVRAVRTRGFACPRDVSVVALNDTGLCALFDPSLTSIDVSATNACGLAVDLLLSCIESEGMLGVEDSPPLLRCGLTIRDSCAKPGDSIGIAG